MKQKNGMINITIDGTENNKSEIIYNNVIQNMELSEEEQVRYLKLKVSLLEMEMRNKMWLLILTIISLIGMGSGIYFLMIDIYFLGIILVVGTFSGVVAKLFSMYKIMMDMNHNTEFDKIEHLRKMLNMKLK